MAQFFETLPKQLPKQFLLKRYHFQIIGLILQYLYSLAQSGHIVPHLATRDTSIKFLKDFTSTSSVLDLFISVNSAVSLWSTPVCAKKWNPCMIVHKIRFVQLN